MKCKDCLYEDNCKLRKMANNLVGCEGYCKEKPPKQGEVKCSHCKCWKPESRAFKHKTNDSYLCFDCY